MYNSIYNLLSPICIPSVCLITIWLHVTTCFIILFVCLTVCWCIEIHDWVHLIHSVSLLYIGLIGWQAVRFSELFINLSRKLDDFGIFISELIYAYMSLFLSYNVHFITDVFCFCFICLFTLLSVYLTVSLGIWNSWFSVYSLCVLIIVPLGSLITFS